jgi:hypothetical protein
VNYILQISIFCLFVLPVPHSLKLQLLITIRIPVWWVMVSNRNFGQGDFHLSWEITFLRLSMLSESTIYNIDLKPHCLAWKKWRKWSRWKFTLFNSVCKLQQKSTCIILGPATSGFACKGPPKILASASAAHHPNFQFFVISTKLLTWVATRCITMQNFRSTISGLADRMPHVLTLAPNLMRSNCPQITLNCTLSCIDLFLCQTVCTSGRSILNRHPQCPVQECHQAYHRLVNIALLLLICRNNVIFYGELL